MLSVAERKLLVPSSRELQGRGRRQTKAKYITEVRRIYGNLQRFDFSLAALSVNNERIDVRI
jgi:hypothetical protein